tara:strand:+ start:173 stop:340 length:168 start_codon:yes stop_codon:yes gene_type:complete
MWIADKEIFKLNIKFLKEVPIPISRIDGYIKNFNMNNYTSYDVSKVCSVIENKKS